MIVNFGLERQERVQFQNQEARWRWERGRPVRTERAARKAFVSLCLISLKEHERTSFAVRTGRAPQRGCPAGDPARPRSQQLVESRDYSEGRSKTELMT